MAAGKCTAAYHTDEWHGYGCSITEGACMFLFPDSKACAEKYGEGPDAVNSEGGSEECEGFECFHQQYGICNFDNTECEGAECSLWCGCAHCTHGSEGDNTCEYCY